MMESVTGNDTDAQAQSHALQGNLLRFPTHVYNPSTVRHRIRTTRLQVEVLDAMFEVNPSPSRKVKDELASEIGMTPKQVQVWFQNKRATAKLKQRQEDAKREAAQAKRNRLRRRSRSLLSSNDGSDYGERDIEHTPSGRSPATPMPLPSNPVINNDVIHFDSRASAADDQAASASNSHPLPSPKFMDLVANRTSAPFFPRAPGDSAPQALPIQYHAPWIPPNEGTPEAMFARHRSLPGNTLRTGLPTYPTASGMLMDSTFGATGGIRRVTHRSSALGLMQLTYPAPPSDNSESSSVNIPMNMALPPPSTHKNGPAAFCPHPLASHPYITSKPQRFRTNSRRPLLSSTSSFELRGRGISSSDGDSQLNPYVSPSSSAFTPMEPGIISYPVSYNRTPESCSPGYNTTYSFPPRPAAPPSGPLPSSGYSFGSMNSRVERQGPSLSISSISTSMSGGSGYGDSADSPVSYASSYAPSSDSAQYPYSRLGSIASLASTSPSSFLEDPISSGNAIFPPSSHDGGNHSTPPCPDADPALIFPLGFQRDARRASCPANFMDTFATLHVAEGAQPASQQTQSHSELHYNNSFSPEVSEVWSDSTSAQVSFESQPQTYQHQQHQQGLYPLNYPFPSIGMVPEGTQQEFFPPQQQQDQYLGNELIPTQAQPSFHSHFDHDANDAGTDPQAPYIHIVDDVSPTASSSGTYTVYHGYSSSVLGGTPESVASEYSDASLYEPHSIMTFQFPLPPSTSSLAGALGPKA